MEEAGNRPRVENQTQNTQSATLTFVPSKRTPIWHPNDPLTTPEGWTEGEGVCLGEGGRGNSGERGGAWPTHLGLWEWVSIWVVIFSCHHQRGHHLPHPPDHGFLPSAHALGLFGSQRDQGIPLGPPKQWDVRDSGEGGQIQGSGRDSLPPGREGSPRADLEAPPRDFFLLLGPLPPEVAGSRLPVAATAETAATAAPG